MSLPITRALVTLGLLVLWLRVLAGETQRHGSPLIIAAASLLVAVLCLGLWWPERDDTDELTGGCDND